MGKSTTRSLALGVTLLCTSAAALATATVDYRHEYRLRDRTHYDKLGLSTTLPDNMFLGVETKFKTGGADPKDKYYNDTVLNVVEVTFLKSYYRGNWTLSPFIQPDLTLRALNGNLVWHPGIKLMTAGLLADYIALN